MLYLVLALSSRGAFAVIVRTGVRPPMIRQFGAIDVYSSARGALDGAADRLAFVGGGMIGLVVAVMRVSPCCAAAWLGDCYINLVQGTPLLAAVRLLLRAADLRAPGPALDRGHGGLLDLCGGLPRRDLAWRLQAIPRTQWEAGASLGLSFGEQLRYVIMPQAVRIAIPPTVGFLVQLIKNTSLAAIIGFVELTREGQITTASTFQPFTVYIAVAAFYFLMCFPLTQWSRRSKGGSMSLVETRRRHQAVRRP